MDYLLICSNFEGGPANLPEAIGTGTPVLATPVGMVPDFVRHGVNGLLLSGRVDDDAELVGNLAERDNALVDALRRGARAAASTIPSWREVVRRHFDLYQQIALGKRSDA
jgi:glycosyltransferase involved in cell wall biosynthesis